MFYILLFIALYCNHITAMDQQTKHASELEKYVISKTTHSGNRVLLPISRKYRHDHLLTSKELIAVIQARLQNITEYGDSCESFIKDHLSLLVLAYHRNDKETFKQLLQVPHIKETIFTWQELKKSESSIRETRGTIQEYIQMHQQDDAGKPIAELEMYKNLLQRSNQQIAGSSE